MSAVRKVAVLGGDARELVIARRFQELGAGVACHGTPAPTDDDPPMVADLAAALTDADVIVTPAPGMAEDTSLYAPASATPIRLSTDVLALASDGAHLFAGAFHPEVEEAARSAGVRCHAFAEDDRLQVRHAIPTAEGAIARTIEHFDGTINHARALVVGYGRIAVILSAYLRSMGASTVVAARRPEIRARAVAAGHESIETMPQALADAAATADLLYTTAPAHLVTVDVLQQVRPHALVMDLASPPGGLDHAAAEKLGVEVVWARGQAGTAPTHSGYAQFDVMVDLLRGLGAVPDHG